MLTNFYLCCIPDQLREYYTPEFEAAVMKSVLTGKVMQLIREAADVTEV